MTLPTGAPSRGCYGGGQGTALGTAAFIASELQASRLVQLGHTRVPMGDYVLLESKEGSTAPLRKAIVDWLGDEITQRE